MLWHNSEIVVSYWGETCNQGGYTNAQAIDCLPNARTRGKTKYGILRTFKVILDLFTVKFLGSYSSSPIYFFGTFGFFLAFCGILSGIVTLIEKYTLGTWVHKNPLILLAIFLFILGFQFILIGLLAELLIRTYHESQNKPPYFIKKIMSAHNKKL